MLVKSEPVSNNNTDAIDSPEEYKKFKLDLEKYLEGYKKKKLQEKKLFAESDHFKVDTESGRFQLDKIIQTVSNTLELSNGNVPLKEKSIDDVDERPMDIFYKKLLNIVSGPYSHENNEDILWNKYTFLFNERKRLSCTKFSYKTVVKELRDMNFHI
ncbi:hypothetical protein RhiirA4_460641, partial [Rhizophagus irregularis]